VAHLVSLVMQMAPKGWSDLEKHLEKNPMKITSKSGIRHQTNPNKYPLGKCPKCDGTWLLDENRESTDFYCDHLKPPTNQEEGAA